MSTTYQLPALHRRSLAVLSLIGALAFGCSQTIKATTDASSVAADTSAADATVQNDASTDASDSVSQVIPPGCDCPPGGTLGCATDFHVNRCGADCHTLTPELCTDPDGNQTNCVSPGVCLQCVPGTKTCDPKNSLQTMLCDANGNLVADKLCNSDNGEVCNASGGCEKACSFNAKAKSYVGCSFWATDLDNAFVPGGQGNSSYFDAANAQYSVVVSNPSDKLSASITISNNEGPQLIDSHGDALDTSPLGPGELRVFNLPPRNIDATSLEPLAWRVSSTVPIAAYQFNPLENVNVFSNDASLLLPDELLGKYYIIMSREESFTILRGFLTVVGTVPGGTTHVIVTFSKTTGRTLAGTYTKTVDGKTTEVPIKSYGPGEQASFDLQQWDTLNIETDVVGGDLTGTVVLADKPVAVFGGSEAANAPNTNHCNVDTCTDKQLQQGVKCGVCEWDKKTPCGTPEHCAQFITCCADHLEMQLFPVKTWDSDYVAVKLFPRNQELDVWRVMAGSDGTKVALNPPQYDEQGKSINIPVLDTGEWFEFAPRNPASGKGDYTPNMKPAAGECNFEIIAKHDDGSPAAIAVGHFMTSQDSPNPGQQAYDAGTGDPAFLLAIPVAQWREQFVFLIPPKYSLNYISIAAPVHRSCAADTPKPSAECSTEKDCGDGAKVGSCADDVEVLIDGSPVAPEYWKSVNAKYKFTRMALDEGPHTVTATPWKDATGKVNKRQVAVDVYGFDQYVSYGYPAGLDLKDINLVKEP